jgi:hypothetical protein
MWSGSNTQGARFSELCRLDSDGRRCAAASQYQGRIHSPLQASDGLATKQGRLRALNGAHTHLARMIKAAAQPNGASRGGALFIERPTGKPPHQVFVVGLPEKSAFAFECQVPLALVLAKDTTQ